MRGCRKKVERVGTLPPLLFLSSSFLAPDSKEGERLELWAEVGGQKKRGIEIAHLRRGKDFQGIHSCIGDS